MRERADRKPVYIVRRTIEDVYCSNGVDVSDTRKS